MIQVSSEIEEARDLTFKGLDDSYEALEFLKQDCINAARLIKSDVVSGAPVVASTVESVHQFIVFEQQIVDLFEVDAEKVSTADDSLWQAELDMHNLLVEFNTKSDAMDLMGVADLLGADLAELLSRFQILLPVLKETLESDGAA